jgi:hypothetical protein
MKPETPHDSLIRRGFNVLANNAIARLRPFWRANKRLYGVLPHSVPNQGFIQAFAPYYSGLTNGVLRDCPGWLQSQGLRYSAHRNPLLSRLLV